MSSTTITNNRELYAKKIGDDLFISVKLNSPYHNVRMNSMEVRIHGNDSTISLINRYTHSCLCEPCGVISTRRNTQYDGSGSLNDNFIDPQTRIVKIQKSLSIKELSKSDDGKELSIKLQDIGDNPGRKNIKFIVLVFEITQQNQIHHQVYLTMKILKKSDMGKELRGYTSKDTCFFSDLIQNEEDEFIQTIVSSLSNSSPVNSSPSNSSSGNSTLSTHEPSKRKKTPKRVRRDASVILDQRFTDFMNEDSIHLQDFDTIGINQSRDYPDPRLDSFNNVQMSKIHFEYGPNFGGQVNAVYLSFKDNPANGGLAELVRTHTQSLNIRFIPKYESEIEIGIPQVLHANPVGNDMCINFVTSPVISPVKRDIETWVFLTINDEVLDGNVEYTFYEPKNGMKSNEVQHLNYTQVDPNKPVITIANTGQFAKQQYHQSLDYFDDLEHFTQNFETQFGSIVDIFGFNFAGFLKYNKFNVGGLVFKEEIYPDSSIENTPQESSMELLKSTPVRTDFEVRKEENILSAEEATNKIVESIKNRIHLQSDEKMIANAVETLSHKMTNSLDAKESLSYFINNIVPQKHLDNSYNPGKRHARNDRIPYLNLKIVIYDSAAIPSQDAQNITPKLKVALFFAKFVISFDEKSHLIIIEDQEQKDNFLYQTFYDCNIYTVRKNDEIDQFLLKLSEFNCSWNNSQFYDEKNSNTGHYAISALKYLGIWDETQPWAKFAKNVCERKPLEKYVTVYPDFFHMDSKNKIPATLTSVKAACCPLLTKALNNHIESQSDAPFKYEFSGYSEDPQVESKVAREELEFFCEFLKDCGESYLRNMEDGVRIQRWLRKVMQTNYGQSLSPETLEHLKPLSDKHNQTFHKQMYNFPNFSNLVNPTQESENLEKKTKLIWENMQNRTNTISQ